MVYAADGCDALRVIAMVYAADGCRLGEFIACVVGVRGQDQCINGMCC
jgi:hypothetical protein